MSLGTGRALRPNRPRRCSTYPTAAVGQRVSRRRTPPGSDRSGAAENPPRHPHLDPFVRGVSSPHRRLAPSPRPRSRPEDPVAVARPRQTHKKRPSQSSETTTTARGAARGKPVKGERADSSTRGRCTTTSPPRGPSSGTASPRPSTRPPACTLAGCADSGRMQTQPVEFFALVDDRGFSDRGVARTCEGCRTRQTPPSDSHGPSEPPRRPPATPIAPILDHTP